MEFRKQVFAIIEDWEKSGKSVKQLKFRIKTAHFELPKEREVLDELAEGIAEQVVGFEGVSGQCFAWDVDEHYNCEDVVGSVRKALVEVLECHDG